MLTKDQKKQLKDWLFVDGHCMTCKAYTNAVYPCCDAIVNTISSGYIYWKDIVLEIVSEKDYNKAIKYIEKTYQNL